MKVISVPFSSGGVTAGPAFLPGYLVPLLRKSGRTIDILEPFGPVTRPSNLTSRDQVADWLHRAGEAIATVDQSGEPLLIIGGDHTITPGTMAGLLQGNGEKPLGCLWIDAHPDLNTDESSPSGNPHGMSLRFCLGGGDERLATLGGVHPKVRVENTALVGIRAPDPGEEQFRLDNPDLLWITADDANYLGPDEVADRVISQLEGTRAVISIDLDAIDPDEFPIVSTPEPDGLTILFVTDLLRRLREAVDIAAIELVEVDLNRPEGLEYLPIVVELVDAAFE